MNSCPTLLALALLASSPALAQTPVGTFSGAASVRVIDGDTIDMGGERIRLRSEAGPIDAPELRSAKCPLELFRAEAARDRLKALVEGRQPAVDRTGADRYGRTVAIVRVGGKDVGAILVAEGHAKMWLSLRSKDRPTWCEG